MSDYGFFKPKLSRTNLDDKTMQQWVDAIITEAIARQMPRPLINQMIDILLKSYKSMHGYEPEVIGSPGY